MIGRTLLFSIPALANTRQLNHAEDKKRKAQEKYPPIIKRNNLIGLVSNLIFFIAVTPFFVTLQTQSVTKILIDSVLILMIYDFFYYLMHRFLFHGQGYFRRVHALHHQARSPTTHIDAYYVHPVETFMGIALFMLTIVGLGLFLGPYHSATLVIVFLIFTQLNTVNHTHVDLQYFPFKTLSWITAKHSVHHENMHKGNYATITLLYDKLFGTFE
ncbi:sterol desaturase family protein [Oceanicoccus sp. KOV_DT_Chl]|uniref:sterol desaturase family protein n=1 Tax=Oceanicoccus sp. KOV_DT_Chl TaxID=1904639 RepID=UPI00135BFF5A|nr:sterol desaturase family protein [Oceanicoccus sp. KOV_DT_Chl]